MYAAATDGSSANNKQFSMCSRSSIASIIDKVGCLTKVAAYCGNGIVEEGEVCDCGVGCAASSCCTSTCQVNTDYGYTCAPQDPIKFPCCTPEDGSLNQCQSISADVKKLCDPASECTLDTYCDGSSSTCPSVITEPDGSECDCYEEDCINHPQTGAKICSSGKCNTWKCSVFGAERCIGDGLSCALSCKGGSFGDGSTCVSTFDKDLRPSTINVTGLYVGEGTTCDEYKGYCSKRGYCYSVGSDLASRWKERGTDFFLAYGWTILAGVLAITLLQVGFRRLYRVKRREGYEALPDMDRRRHREYVIGRGFPPVERRDGFEHWDSDDDESTEDEVNLSGEQEESNMDNLAADYDRQTLQVVFDNFKQRIQRCMVPANLPSIEADIRAYKDDASKLDFSRLQVLELQTAYNDRRCVLLGLPIDPPTKLSVATDAVCTAIDTSRQITQQVNALCRVLGRLWPFASLHRLPACLCLCASVRYAACGMRSNTACGLCCSVSCRQFTKRQRHEAT